MNPLLDPEAYWPAGMPRPGEAPTNLPPAVANLGLGTLSQALGPESLGYYTGPHAYEALKNAGTVAGYLTPSFGKEQAVAAGTEAERGNYGKAAALGGLGLAGAAADMIPGEALVKAGVKGATKLPNVLDLVKDYLPTTGAAAILPARVGGMGGLGGAPIKAYHGSPHDFDAFDLSKIGTGEGAQAYGHGLYFAENEGTARSYRDALSGDIKFQGTPKDFVNLTDNRAVGVSNVLKHMTETGSKPEEAISAVREHLAQLVTDMEARSPRWSGPAKAYNQDRLDGFKAALQGIERISPADFQMPSGKMYEVALHADPERFLDWDKPLSAQPAGRDALNALWTHPQKSLESQTAGQFYQGNVGPGRQHPEVFNDKMVEAGIPGIKYLDAGSRTAGDGSRNFVTFDDKIVEILRKYGIAGLAALGGANGVVNMGLGQPAPKS